ncbi:MAG: hypothetical protein OHK0046_27590 [Anaerolineae bacterium]
MPVDSQIDERLPDGTLRRVHVPVLMYHYISRVPDGADDIRINLTTEPPVFRTHLQYLRDYGYTTVSLEDVYHALTVGAALPEKPIVLTFDDGHLDHYTDAFPALREFGFTGTFFIITDLPDTGNVDYMSWAQIQEMAAAGMHIAAHSKTHRDLRERDMDFLVYEIVGSMESVAAHTGIPNRTFAYPAGRYDEQTLAVMRSIPATVAVTTEPGAYHTTDGLLEIPRLRISGNLGVVGLEQLLLSSR